MIAGILKESFPDEKRVALIPPDVPGLSKAGAEIIIESEAGTAAGFPNETYREKGARIAEKRGDVFASSDVLLMVRGAGANPQAALSDIQLMKEGQIVIGLLDPFSTPELVQELAKRGVSSFAMELIPRITRAQSMDSLSSMATITGYKAVLLAAEELPRMFPMLMTASGTIVPARVFVVGAGVAGLQAIATSRRLGAIVQAYDIRPASREQVISLGAKFVEMELETEKTEDKGGYAKAMDEEFYRKQREMMSRVVSESDVVITTAAVPGKKAPILITEEMVKGMKPGSVIVDVAAERGGNCELTEAGKTIKKHGVTISGPANLPATVPYHASQMYSKNVSNFLLLLVKDGKLTIDMEDEILRETLVTHEGEIVNAHIREMAGNVRMHRDG